MKNNSIISLIAAIPAFILCTVVRYIQIAGGTDFTSGFLKNENGFLINYGFYGLVILTLAAVVALGLYDKKKGGALYTNELPSCLTDAKAVMIGFPLVIVGSLAAYEGYAQVNSLTPSGFLIFIDFVFGGAMLIQGFVILYKKEMGVGQGFSLIIPALYYTLRGVGVFLDRMVVASVPEYLIQCLSIIGFASFFMLLSKLLSGNEAKHTRTALTAVGASTAVMALSSATATILADLTDPYGLSARIVSSAAEAERLTQIDLQYGSAEYYFMAYMPWVDVAMAAGILLTLAALFMKASPAEKSVSEAAEDSSEEN